MPLATLAPSPRGAAPTDVFGPLPALADLAPRAPTAPFALGEGARPGRSIAELSGATVLQVSGPPPPTPGGAFPIGGVVPPGFVAPPPGAAVPGAGGKGKGDVRPLGPAAQEFGRGTLANEATPDPAHPYVADQEATRGALSRLGISTRGQNRIHIDDLNWEHGRSVALTAAGRTSLASGNQVSLGTMDAPREVFERVVSPEARARGATIDARADQVVNGTLDAAGISQLGVDMLESTLVEKQARLADIRGDLPKPPDGKKTFVNMSWGQTPEETSTRLGMMMMMAPPDSPAGKEVAAVLGHPPTLKDLGGGRTELNKDEVALIREKLTYPRLAAAMAEPENKKNLDAARAGIAHELAEGRKEGMMVFQAAGNSFVRAGSTPEMSRGIHDGIPGFVTVGAIDTHGPGAADDRVSAFSSDGRISLSAPGSRIPVGVDFDAETGKPRAKDVEGTSFASPYALQVAAAMSAANPKLSVDELERRLTDPRALHDIAGTTRDGAGVIDPFAAVLLARNPNLSREQIDAAQAALANPKADVRAIRRSLGL